MRAAILLGWLMPVPAFAYTHQYFYGWSADNSIYGSGSDQGTSQLERPRLCVTDPERGSRTWPKQVPAPEGSCTELCEHSPDGEATSCQERAAAAKWVRRPKATPRGPAGEKIVLVAGKDGVRVEAHAADGKQLGMKFVDLSDAKDPSALKRAGAVFWRPDGGGVAVLLGASDEEEGRSQAPGWPAPRYLAIISWRATADAPPDPRAAGAANTAAMGRYRAKDYRAAADGFRRAVLLDPSHLLAHYNLACVEALLGDADAATDELKWIAARNNAAADERLVKAARDPDLKSVIGDPEVKRLVDGAVKRAATPPKSCKEACERAFDRCSASCPDDGGARACGRACGADEEECQAKCGR